MKHLKIYEKLYNDDDDNYYWLLPTDKRLKASLKKIQCTKYKIRIYSQYQQIKEKPFAFFSCENYDDSEQRKINSNWGWNPFYGNILDDYYEENGFKFQGFINIEPYELDALKYNL